MKYSYFFLGIATGLLIFVIWSIIYSAQKSNKVKKKSKTKHSIQANRDLLYKVYLHVSMIGDRIIYNKSINTNAIIHRFHDDNNKYFLFLGSDCRNSIIINDIIKGTLTVDHGITNFAIPLIFCDNKMLTHICDIKDVSNSIIISHADSTEYCDVYTIINRRIRYVFRINEIKTNPYNFNILYDILLNDDKSFGNGSINVFFNTCYSFESNSDTFSFETAPIVKTLLELNIESATKQYCKYYNYYY